MKLSRLSLSALFLLVLGYAFISAAGEKWAYTNFNHSVKIALVSDVHINRGTNQALYQSNFEKAIQQVNNARVDAVVLTGDLTEDGTKDEYADFKRLVKRFNAPSFMLPGNHDIGNKKIGGKKNEISFKRLIDYHLIIGRSWFSTEIGGVRLIGVNSMLFGSGFKKELQMWKFLESELGKKSTKPLLVFMHYPPFRDKPEEKGGEYWNLEPAQRFRLFGLFQQADVNGVFSGHLHYSLTNKYNGVLYYTTHPTSFGLPKGKQKPGWTLITVSNDGIKLKQFSIEPDKKQ